MDPKFSARSDLILSYYRDIYYAKYYGKGGEGKWPSGEKNEIRKKHKKKGKEKRRKIKLKKGEKALKMHLFGL